MQVVGELLVADEDAQPNAPADLYNQPVVREWTAGQYGTDSVRSAELVGIQRRFGTPFEKVNADVNFSFSPGRPNH